MNRNAGRKIVICLMGEIGSLVIEVGSGRLLMAAGQYERCKNPGNNPERKRGSSLTFRVSRFHAAFWTEARVSRSLASFSLQRFVLIKVPPNFLISSITLSAVIWRIKTHRAAVPGLSV